MSFPSVLLVAFSDLQVTSTQRMGRTQGKIAVIEGVVGFAVVLDPKYSAYVSTINNPHVAFERLNKDIAKRANGPMNLLETMKIDIAYRKILTRKRLTCIAYISN